MTPKDSQWVEETLHKLTEKVRAECERTGDAIPFFPVNGRYVDAAKVMPDGISWWTNGFWPGLLWQMYHATQDELYKETAQKDEQRMDAALQEFTRLHHDVGLMFLPSAGADYKLTGDKDARRRALHATALLAGRFNSTGNYIRAWDEAGWLKADPRGCMIIDTLLNLPLLYWASEETGDPRFADIAARHAHTSLNTILRPDGSCHHVAEFDPATGAFLHGHGGQGYADGSSWSRGQGWALYGFALSYRHTQDTAFLDAAKRSAHYCIAALAVNDWLPLVDFRAPAEPVKYDSGAGCIIAAGLLELAEHVPELEKSFYTDAALRILLTIDAKFCDWSPETDGLVGGGWTMYHDDRLANMAFTYNDYFFAEAVLRLAGKAMQIW